MDGVSPWRLAGASVRGTAHLAAGLPCQDAHALALFGDTLLAVVSDGAGSAAHAEAGSRAVCEGYLAWYRDHADIGLADFDAEGLLAFLQAHLAELAATLDTRPRELAATLLLALVRPEEALFVQVGDGGMAFAQPDADLALAFWPDEGEYAGTTTFVTDAAPEQLRTLYLPAPVTRLALFSDGLQHVCLRYDEQKLHTPFFAPFFDALHDSEERDCFEARLARTLDGERMNALSDDDKTLLLALRA